MTDRKTISKISREWLGATYHHHARVKKADGFRATDCANLLVAVFHEAKMVSDLDLGFYPTDWHMNRSEELFIGWLQKVGAKQIEKPEEGDIALFRFGRTFSHGGIMLDTDTCIHAYINRGVIITRLNEFPLQDRKVQFWSMF